MSSHAVEIWGANMDEAKQLAQKEGKLIFVAFIGSDWSKSSLKLKDKITYNERLTELLKETAIMVALDYPKKSVCSVEQTQKNGILKEFYGVSSLPTLIMTDATGRKLATYGGDNTIQDMVKFVKEMKEQGVQLRSVLNEIASAQGDERFKKIGAFLNPMTVEDACMFYPELVKALEEDKNGVSGCGKIREMQNEYLRGQEEANEFIISVQDTEEPVALYNKVEESLKAPSKLSISARQMIMGTLQVLSLRDQGKYTEAMRKMDEAIALRPYSMMARDLKEQKESLLREDQLQREGGAIEEVAPMFP